MPLAPTRRSRPRHALGTVLALSTAGVLLAAGVLAWQYYRYTQGTEVLSQLSPDGKHELVVKQWSAGIDHAYDVNIRRTNNARLGLPAQRQEELVWRGAEHFEQPSVRFVHNQEIEIVARDVYGSAARVYRSRLDSGTLQVSPVHCLSEGYC